MRLHVKAVTYASAILFGISMLLFGWLGILGIGKTAIGITAKFYPGYAPTFWGGIIGFLWGILSGAIYGFLFAVVYNFVLRICKKDFF